MNLHKNIKAAVCYIRDSLWLNHVDKAEFAHILSNAEKLSKDKYGKVVAAAVLEFEDRIKEYMSEFVKLGGQLTPDFWVSMPRKDKLNYGYTVRRSRVASAPPDTKIAFHNAMGEYREAAAIATASILSDIEEAASTPVANSHEDYVEAILNTRASSNLGIVGAVEKATDGKTHNDDFLDNSLLCDPQSQ